MTEFEGADFLGWKAQSFDSDGGEASPGMPGGLCRYVHSCC